MARITKYIIILSLIVISFNAAGLMPDTPISSLMSWAINPSGMSGNSTFLAIFGILGIVSAGIITIGVILPGKIDIAIMSPLVIFFTTILIWDFVAIYGVVAIGIGTLLASLIFSPFIIAFAIDTVSWWMGRQ